MKRRDPQDRVGAESSVCDGAGKGAATVGARAGGPGNLVLQELGYTWFHRPAGGSCLRRRWPAPHMRRRVGDAAVGIPLLALTPHMQSVTLSLSAANCSDKRYYESAEGLLIPFSIFFSLSGEEEKGIDR